MYLLWDVIYTVLIQEKLNDVARNARGHLLQSVVSQVELQEALQVLQGVLSQAGVTQLTKTSHAHIFSTNPPSCCCCFDEAHLVVVQVKQSQVLHLVEGSGRNLRNEISVKTNLFQRCWEA